MVKNPNKRKIYYIGYADVLKGRVGPIIEMQTCRAIAASGHKVILVVPTYWRPENISREKIWEYYGIPKDDFQVKMLPTFLKDTSSLLRTRLAMLITNFFMAMRVLWDVIISPDESVALIFWTVIETYPYLFILAPVRWLKKVPFIYELHSLGENTWLHKYMLKRMDGILCISEALRKELCTTLPYDESKTIIGRPGVSAQAYPQEINVVQLRKGLGLPESAWIAMYTGKISPNLPEINIIVEAAKKMKDVLFLFAGGKPEAVEYWNLYCEKNGIKNVRFIGFVPPNQISSYQLSADALLLCYASDLYTKEVTSPGKMLEYMYAAKPIVAVDFPVLREVLRHDENALLVPPDDPNAIADALKVLMADKALCAKLGERAREDAKEHTWEKRAQRFQALINKVSN